VGNANTILDPVSARHLLRRTGFGARPADVQAILDRQLTRGQAVDELMAFESKPIGLGGYYVEKIHAKWLKTMVRSRYPLQGKLVLFWHDHFATSNAKVDNLPTMGVHIDLIHTHCKGDFKAFVKAMNRDSAMILFLDTRRNLKESPNENYARELQELFTLGVYDFAGNPNYTQQDVVQIARAFSGWHDWGFRDYEHDYQSEFLAARGPKVIYQSTGGFGPGGAAFDVDGEGPQEIDAVTDIIFEHVDGDGKHTVARRMTRRLFEYFAYEIPDPIDQDHVGMIDQLIDESGFASSWDIAALLRAMFVHDRFYETAAPAPFVETTRKSVRWPVDYVVTALRLLSARLDKQGNERVRGQLSKMGQVLLEPPSVFGWEWELGWIGSAALLARYDFASYLTSIDEDGRHTFRPERQRVLVDGESVRLSSLTDPAGIVRAAADILGVPDLLTSDEHDALVAYLSDDGLNATIDLNDEQTLNEKLYGLFALMLQCPGYHVH